MKPNRLTEPAEPSTPMDRRPTRDVVSSHPTGVGKDLSPVSFSGSDYVKFAAIGGGIVGAIFWLADYAFQWVILSNHQPPGDTPGLIGILVGASIIIAHIYKLNHRK